MCEFISITENDIPVILSMMENFYAIDGYPIDIEKSNRLFETFIADENLGKAWLIYSDGEVAGYVILTTIFSFEYGGKIAFIDELYIKEEFRGKGIGKASVTFLKEAATKLGLKLLYLEVEHHNSNAQELYLKSGFSLHNRRLMQYKIK
ncbi:GNAT family N-acetyltransferase [Flavobacterium pallidum]|uniref:N-acetyltransferase n=1 Tax=Flavobacterium pallidum TaxID=2172098 RepID=A0A2S1SE92_9FLAO|nr:GNAT family N-acetyltransferase [Flavobacterium pallidum]AWI24708.1 N-acetyltransferase [Flavobacterium pallidum]